MKKLTNDDWTPDFFVDKAGNYFAKVMMSVHRCPICGAFMSSAGRISGISFESNLTAKVGNNDVFICSSCVSDGKSTFACAMCNETYSSTEVQESFGCYPYEMEYLCKTCFHVVTAADWEEKCTELENKHRHDYE